MHVGQTLRYCVEILYDPGLIHFLQEQKEIKLKEKKKRFLMYMPNVFIFVVK